MFNLTDNELQEYINDDIPYFDLTTYMQDSNDKKARLEIFTREDIVVACSEEAKRIAELLNCRVTSFERSKAKLKKDSIIMEIEGSYEDIHKAWRACQILLEYSCKIATYTSKMKSKIESVNPKCELLSTRKTFPFAKKFCIKGVMVGGGMPHRLGLSETILLFPQHRTIYESDEEFLKKIKVFKHKAPEKKIVVETEEFEDAVALMQHGADVLQVDKIEPEILQKIVEYKNKNYPDVTILVAGGVNLENVEPYAALGIDGVVTSAMYNKGMVNLGSRMSIIE